MLLDRAALGLWRRSEAQSARSLAAWPVTTAQVIVTAAGLAFLAGLLSSSWCA